MQRSDLFTSSPILTSHRSHELAHASLKRSKPSEQSRDNPSVQPKLFIWVPGNREAAGSLPEHGAELGWQLPDARFSRRDDFLHEVDQNLGSER